MGRRAVTEIGTHSVIHQIAIQIVEAKMLLASGLRFSGLKNNITTANRTGPRTNPIFFFEIFI
jgi:hypothetical protein